LINCTWCHKPEQF